MRLYFALALIIMTAGTGDAERLWINNIIVNEYNMTWSYTETFTGADSIAYRMSIDTELGDNDSFINAWELLNADKEMRKKFRISIDRELDVRINNQTSEIELLDVDASLSPDTIGKTHTSDTVVNRYSATYRFKESVLNAGSIWFLGQAASPVTIVLPAGIDVMNISGMDEVAKNITDHAEITGVFRGISKDRGEITLALSKNTSFRMPVNVSNVTSPPIGRDAAKSMTDTLLKLRDASIIAVGLVLVLLIYLFKVKKR